MERPQEKLKIIRLKDGTILEYDEDGNIDTVTRNGVKEKYFERELVERRLSDGTFEQFEQGELSRMTVPSWISQNPEYLSFPK